MRLLTHTVRTVYIYADVANEDITNSTTPTIVLLYKRIPVQQRDRQSTGLTARMQ
jgi:hypothetical protein